MTWLQQVDRTLVDIEALARMAPVQDQAWFERQASRWRSYRALLGGRQARAFAVSARGKGPRPVLAACGCCYEGGREPGVRRPKS